MKRESLNSEASPNQLPLPSGYTKLNYIESQGNQFIITGVCLGPNLKWELDAQWVEFNDNNAFGYEEWNQGAANTRVVCRLNFDKSKTLSIVYGNIPATDPNGLKQYNLPGADATVRHVLYVESGKQCIDGVEVMQATITYTSTGYIMFFESGFANGRGAYICKKTRVYGSWMKNGDTLVRNFVPALRLSDSKPGLYDTVNDVFYTNAGTGEFLYA